MKKLHDPEVRREMETRLAALRPDAQRKRGTMTPDQMVWHLCQFLEFALGEGKHPRGKMPLPLFIMRPMVLYGPWPKSAPTHPSARAGERYDIEVQKKRCLALIDRFVSKPVDGVWPEDAAWGSAGGLFASKLQARHFDYHLNQFGA